MATLDWRFEFVSEKQGGFPLFSARSGAPAEIVAAPGASQSDSKMVEAPTATGGKGRRAKKLAKEESKSGDKGKKGKKGKKTAQEKGFNEQKKKKKVEKFVFENKTPKGQKKGENDPPQCPVPSSLTYSFFHSIHPQI